MKPKILFFDIETRPCTALVWGIGKQYVGHKQIVGDWCVISWAAKWADKPEMVQEDLRNKRNTYDDKWIMKKIWRLLDKADIVVTQNGTKFDVPKLNARFEEYSLGEPSYYQHIDLVTTTGRKFGFTSCSLEFLAKKFCKKYRKYKSRKFVGLDLWKECISKNQKAWEEMAKYNKIDVLVLEELYERFLPWITSVNLSVYSDETGSTCLCGSTKFKRDGHRYTSTGKFQRFECKKCGAQYRGKQNLLPLEKRKTMLVR